MTAQMEDWRYRVLEFALEAGVPSVEPAPRNPLRGSGGSDPSSGVLEHAEGRVAKAGVAGRFEPARAGARGPE